MSSRSAIPNLIWIALALGFGAALTLRPAVAADPNVATGPTIQWQQVADPDAPALDAGEGHVWLRWTTGDPEAVAAFELERKSPGEQLETRRFVEPATFITGLPEGVTEVRVRALQAAAGQEGAAGPWSATLRVTVEYPSRSLVRRLGLLGIVLFLATAGMILAGHYRYSGQSQGADHG